MHLLVSVSCHMTLNKTKHIISLLFCYIYWLFCCVFSWCCDDHVVLVLLSLSIFQLLIFGGLCVVFSRCLSMMGMWCFFVVMLLYFSLGFCIFLGHCFTTVGCNFWCWLFFKLIPLFFVPFL